MNKIRPIKISVVTATWNCEETISDCLASIASQTHPYVEHVVIDGASNDGTLDVIQAHRSQVDIFLSEKDEGIYDALNKGVKHSTGDVVGFLHADDIYDSPDVLAKVAEAFEDESVCAVYGDLLYVKKGDVGTVVRYWKSSPYSDKSLGWGWMPPHPTFYVRREWYSKIGGFDTKYRISADYFSILRFFSLPDFKATYLPFVFVRMRLGGESNRSFKNLIRKSREDLDALRRSGVGGFGSLVWKNLSKLSQFNK